MLVPREISEALGNNQAATCIILCERWLRENPNDRYVLLDYAEMLYKLTRYDDAIDIYQRCIKLTDEDLNCEFNQLGHLDHYRGDYLSATDWYEQAINEDPDCERSRTFLSRSLTRLGRLPEAEGAIRSAIACDNWFPGQTYEQLGLLLRAQGRFEEAADAFRTTLESWENDKDTLAALADVEAAGSITDVTLESIRTAFADHPATCIASIERYLQEEEGDTRTLLMYGTMLTDVWRFDDAERVFDLVLSRGSSPLLAYQGMASLCRRRGDLLQVADWYEKAFHEDPDNADNLILRGSALARSGDLQAAEECHRRATSCLRGDIDEAYLNLGLVLRGQDRLTEAAECFRTALEICEDYEEPAVALNDVETAIALTSETSRRNSG